MAVIQRAGPALGAAALGVVALEVLALAWLVAAVPSIERSVDPARPLAPQLEEIDRAVIQQLPPLVGRFAGGALAIYHEHRAALVEPASASAATDHVRALNDALARIEARTHGATALLLAALLLGGSGLASTLLRRPSVASLLAPLGGGLAATPVITEPLAGADYGAGLVPFVAPLLIGGGALLLANLAALREPVFRAGGAFARHPRLLGALVAVGIGGLGVAVIAIDDTARLSFFVSIGAVLVANALVFLVSALFLAARK